MGWSPGEGLGKDKSGIVTPILVEVKNNRLGLATESEVNCIEFHFKKLRNKLKTFNCRKKQKDQK